LFWTHWINVVTRNKRIDRSATEPKAWWQRVLAGEPDTRLAQTSGTMTVRPVTSSKSKEQEFSRIIRSQGKPNVKVKNRAHRLVKHASAEGLV
jgi:hypothetical protein